MSMSTLTSGMSCWQGHLHLETGGHWKWLLCSWRYWYASHRKPDAHSMTVSAWCFGPTCWFHGGVERCCSWQWSQCWCQDYEDGSSKWVHLSRPCTIRGHGSTPDPNQYRCYSLWKLCILAICMQNTIHSMTVVLMNMNSDWLSATLQHLLKWI